jgi:hypothetical protein
MSFTQGQIEKPIIQPETTDADKGQIDYPFSAPIRREDVEGANDDDAMEVEQVCVKKKKQSYQEIKGPF